MSQRPKRKQKSRAARLRPFWFLLVLLAAAAAFGGYYAATWPGFFPREIAVRGNRIVPRSEILARARILPDANLWLQKMGAAANRIEAIPYIKTARIHRSLPAGVRIDVTERVPYAIVKSGPSALLIDRDLRVLQPAPRVSALPVFVQHLAGPAAAGVFLKDEAVMRLRDDYDALAQAHVIVTSLRYDKYGDLDAGMRSGVQLLLGDDSQLAQKTGLIGPILSQVAANGRRIAAVDLRAPKTPVVVYK